MLCEEPFTMGELVAALDAAKTAMVSGTDQITVAVLRNVPDSEKEELHRAIWNTGLYLPNEKRRLLCPFPIQRS